MNISAILLTGGQSQRMGTDKALLRIGQQTFLSLIAHKLAKLSDDVLIVGRKRAGYAEALTHLPVRFVPDSFENCGPLGGLHAGLQAMRYEVAIVVACDMPLINLELLQHMVALLNMGRGEAFGNAIELKPISIGDQESDCSEQSDSYRMLRPYDAVVPQDERGWHPLHAVYRQSCVTPIKQMVHAGDLRVQSLINQINVCAIMQSEMAQFDPQGLSLRNLNTPDELAALGAL